MDELTSEQKQTLLNSFYPDIEDEVKKVIGWLETGKVVLTGVQGEYNHYEYIDNRTEKEKQPTAYQVAPADTTHIAKDNTLSKNEIEQKPW